MEDTRVLRPISFPKLEGIFHKHLTRFMRGSVSIRECAILRIQCLVEGECYTPDKEKLSNRILNCIAQIYKVCAQFHRDDYFKEQGEKASEFLMSVLEPESFLMRLRRKMSFHKSTLCFDDFV